KEYEVRLTIIIDIIHVLDYLWKAATDFHPAGSNEAAEWVTERFSRVLRGQASDTAAGIRRSATLRELAPKDREAADECADYLLKHAEWMRYDHYLGEGFPIATGVGEGACRHLSADRMD